LLGLLQRFHNIFFEDTYYQECSAEHSWYLVGKLEGLYTTPEGLEQIKLT